MLRYLVTYLCLIMNLKFGLWASSFVLLLFLWSCAVDADLDHRSTLLEDYYPIQEGDIRIYAIDSITYDYDGLLHKIVIDTQQYYIQERVLGQIHRNNLPWWRVGLYRSQSLEGEYELFDYVYLRQTSQQLLRQEGNLVFIPLASPLRLYDEWDGTANFNSSQAEFFIRGEILTPYKDWNYVYLKTWDQYWVNGNSYSQVIQVNQKDTLSIQIEDGGGIIPPENQLFYTLANEFYAPGVGLIEKSEYHLTSICASSNVTEFQAFCDTTNIFSNAERGYIYHKKLISFE